VPAAPRLRRLRPLKGRPEDHPHRHRRARGFRQLLEHRSAAIWQPDIHRCGGLTELRRIAALAAAYDIPVIPP